MAKVRTEALQAQRLLTLGEESFSLLDDRTEQPPSRQNPMQEADEANRALQRQLAQTYAPRTSEREVEHLRRQVEELSARLDASPPAASADPLELAERQYQLAQKYLGGGTPHIDTVPAERRRLCVLRPVPERALTASTLGAAADSAQERNAGFLTAEGEKRPEHNTAVSACIAQTQTVRSGEMVRLRLLEEAAVDGARGTSSTAKHRSTACVCGSSCAASGTRGVSFPSKPQLTIWTGSRGSTSPTRASVEP